MGALLAKLVLQTVPEEKPLNVSSLNAAAAQAPSPSVPADSERSNAPVPFTCPECSGPLYSAEDGAPGEVKCITGHRFSPESLSEAHREALERSLLTSLRMLKERSAVYENLARRKQQSDPLLVQRYKDGADAATRDAILLQQILERL